MFARWDDIRFAGKKVTVTLNGSEVDKVNQVMTGKNGFVTFYEQPFRIIGDCLMMRQVCGNVSIKLEDAR